MPSLERIPLAGPWRFAIDTEKIGESAGWAAADFDDTTWREVVVPHTWSVMPDFAHYDGIGWYRYSFTCPKHAGSAFVRLRFDAVFYLARVWLNGQYVGVHEGGYTPFEFDISDSIWLDAENVIAVQVDNARSTDRLPAHLYEGRSFWENYGGIVRDVRLLLTDRVYISAVRVEAVPRLSGVDQAESAAISALVILRNTSEQPFEGNLTAEILDDASGQTVFSIPSLSLINLAPLQMMAVPLKADLPEPKLWHFDHPNLYCWSTHLLETDGREVDRNDTIFGIRKVELKDNRFYLNGEPVRLAGLSRHASVPGYGTAETEAVMAADFDDLKRLNMVIGRPVHYPQHEFVYDYCDRKGILLSPELPAWQLTAGQMADEHMRTLARQQLAEMIGAAANHPCVWAWSVGNELESDTVAGRAFVRDMVGYVKSLDKTRPVSFASYHLLVGRPWGDATKFTDFVMMNQYFGTWHGPKDCLGVALDTIHLTWPEKTVIISEFGFCPHWERIEGPARVDTSQYYFLAEDAAADSPEADALRQCVIRDQMAVFRYRPFVAAATFWDYRGEMGVVGSDGQRRGSWEILRQEYAPVLFAAVDFAFPTGNKCQVQIRLHTRGPVEVDLPAYTLRNYRLHWEFVSPDGKVVFSQGDVDLPMLTPGTDWSEKVEAAQPPKNIQFRVSVIRPTGFIVIEWSGSLPDTGSQEESSNA